MGNDANMDMGLDMDIDKDADSTESTTFEEAEGHPVENFQNTASVDIPMYHVPVFNALDYLNIPQALTPGLDFLFPTTDLPPLEEVTSASVEESILRTDVLSMFQPEDIDPALLDSNFDFDFTTNQPYTPLLFDSLMNPSPTVPTLDPDITDLTPPLPPFTIP
ncbi:hypothetical protein TWF696_004913 [Orbilia brochopaga]|uniref:Uncharacterized protein n=1 Tax=Orbilia brochopaga TaxID=3140254 RepID=A0AAV9UZ51_9PEZI